MIPLYPLFVLLYPVSAWVGFYPRPVNNPQISIRNKQPVNDFAILISGPDNSSPSIDRQIQCDGLPPDLNIAPFLTGQGWKHIPATIAWGSWSHPVSALALGNLREVCTKTAYGGSKAFNMGLWCDSESGGVRSQEFVPLRGSNAALGVLLMTCHMRCKCVPAELRDRLPASKVLESEGIGDREAVLGPLEGTERWWTRDGKRLFEVDYATEADGPVRYLLMTANPKHSNPRCEGRLPTWPLPESLRSRGVTYRSLQELCAATWFGGNVLGNTGAVCETEADQTHLRFLDYMAHPLLENRNFPAGTLLSLWCQSQCKCNSTEGILKQLPEVSLIRDAFLFTAKFPLDSIALTVSGPLGTQNITPEMIDETTSLNTWASNFQVPGSSSSGSRSPGSCSWPQASSSREPECLTCRRRCTTNTDCQTRGGRACKCVGTPTRKTPARFFGSCAIEAFKGFRGAPGGKKRDLEAVNCVCNETYVSRSCCGSVNGLVWEDKQLFMGSLA